MRLTNDALRRAVEAHEALCGPMNRLPTLAHLAAARNLSELRRAWQPVSEVRDRLIQEHGQGDKIRPDMPGWPAFLKEVAKLGAEEQEIKLETISDDDLGKAFGRDPETGKKGPLEIDGAHLTALYELGIVVDSSQPKETDGEH